MKLLFLGTASMVPTKDRNMVSTLLRYKDENILIDVGEGTQRQLRIAHIYPTRITKILITHWHSDHVFGLPGLLETMAWGGYNKTLEIYGPPKTKFFIKKIQDIFVRKEDKIKIKTMEIKKDGIFYKDKFILEAVKLKHPAPCLAYSFKEPDKRKINLKYTKKFGLTRHPLLGKLQKGKSITFKGKKISANKATILKKGKKISFIFDTGLVNNCFKIAKDSDILVCESTFSHELKDKAKEYKHLTSKQAALIAKKANVKKLLLTHFSQRYGDVKMLEKEAKQVFKNSKAVKDFDVIPF